MNSSHLRTLLILCFALFIAIVVFSFNKQGLDPSLLGIISLVATTNIVLFCLWTRKQKEEFYRQTKELRETHKLLNDRELGLQELFENMPIACFFYDREGQILKWNRAAEDVYGYTKYEAVGASAFDLIVTPETLEATKQVINGVFQGQKFEGNEWQDHNKEGDVGWRYGNTFPLFTEDSEVVVGVNLNIDITERKLAQESLQLTQHTVDHSAAPILWFTADGTIIYANSAATAMLQYPNKELLTQQISLIHPAQTTEYWDKYYPVIKEQKHLNLELPLRKKNGRLLPALINATYLSYQGHEYIIISFQDLSYRRRIEKELHQAQKMEAIGTLAGGIAHDFNNILSPIFGYAEFALDHMEQPERLKEDLEEIYQAAERAKGLVKQILTFSRKSKREKHPLQVSVLIKEAIKLLRSTIPTTIELKQNITSQQFVLADPVHIHQIVMNLCTNAYHTMRESGGVLSISVKDIELSETELPPGTQMLPGSYIRLQINDTGQGMDKQTLEKIFDPYFTTKEAGEGTGLGLAVAHGIVKDHNGFIHAYSELGLGTSFQVYLPTVKEEEDTSNNANLSSNRTQALTGGNESILVVEDEEKIIKMIKEVLTEYGYSVTAMQNGVQALLEFEKQPDQYDLIITDMAMPYMAGTQLTQKIMEIRPSMPIILCTGHNEHINEEKAMQMGIREYVEKPLVMSELVTIVRRVLDKENNNAK